MRICIRHETWYHYTPPADGLVMKVRLYPSSFDTQVVEGWSVKVADKDLAANHQDGAGTSEAIAVLDQSLEKVSVIAEGVVRREPDNGVLRGHREKMPPEFYLRDTELTEADENISQMASRFTGSKDLLATCHDLCHAVRRAVEYEPGSTHARTTASQALASGRGVCQDHTHIFLSAARLIGIPARYVAGYYAAGKLGDGLVETHAWAEAYVDGLGWVGFDPANEVCPTEEYVRLTTDLDADGAALIRGAIVGSAKEYLTASVAMSDVQQ